MPSKYGADISSREYLRVTLAAGVGSVCEWYDYSVLAALSPIIQQIFFPPGNLAAKQLSFWLVYAVGYVFRPLGSLLFGHICDVLGRRLSLMITLLMMGVPTVLVGCLPTYSQAGLAAPILLAVLRLVQGLAVGGELGTAVVFMHELAPARHKSKGGAIVFVGVTMGIISGILASLIVNAAIPADALLHWGWRIPFLIAIVTVVCGLLLRRHMPESYEFEHDQVKIAHTQSLTQQRLARATSNRSSTGLQQPQHSARELLAWDYKPSLLGGGGQAASDVARSGDTRSSATGAASKQPQQPAAAGAAVVVAPPAPGCWARWQRVWGHNPIKMLLRDHWREAVLLFWLEFWTAAVFYSFYGWLPSFMATNWRVPIELTLGMTLANMSITLAIIPAAAHQADRGVPRLAAVSVVLVVAALVSVPLLLAVSTQKLVAAWLCQLLALSLNATVFGFLPTIGSTLFPVHVRATGYNVAHTASQSWLGGLTPVIISAINLRLQQSSSAPPAVGIYLVTGLLLVVAAVISLVSLSVMWRLFPQTNRDPPAGGSSSVNDGLPLASSVHV